MFEIHPPGCDFYFAQRPVVNNHVALLQSAIQMFNAARLRGTIEQAKSVLRRCSWRLLDLDVIPTSQVRHRRYGGIQGVSLSQICGSMGRTNDFDRHFHSLDDRLRDRWVSVAMTRSQYIPLPPVNLVRVGDRYFVEDGHHRISVVRALHESAIDAEVSVWDVSGLLPWEKQPALQPIHSARSTPLSRLIDGRSPIDLH